MNLTVNLTNSLMYTGTECINWCSVQLEAVESSLGHGELILISLLCMMGYYILNNIDENTLTLFNVAPKDKYARIVKIKKFAYALLDSAFLIQIAFLIVHVIKGFMA